MVQYPAVQMRGGKFTAVSHVRVKASDWEAEKPFTCQAEHPAISASAPMKTTLQKRGRSPSNVSLKINPPSAKDLFEHSKATITCVITGDDKNEVDGAVVSWTVGGSRRESSGTDNVKQTTPPFTKTSSLTLDQSEWFSGSEVECSTEREKTPFSDKIKVKKGGKPSIVFYKPEKDVRDTDTVSLLCEVRSSGLGDVYVMWKMNNGQYMEGSSTVYINEKNTAVVLSYLTVSGRAYNSAQFTCAVKDPNMVAGATPEQKTTSMNDFSLKINPPSAKDLFVRNTATITCVVTGDNKNEVDGAIVSWTVGGSRRRSSGTDNVKQTTPPFTKTSSLTLDQSEWFSGSEVECSTEKEKTPFSDKIKVKKGGKPSIIFYKPEKDVKDTDTVSLLCEVRSSDLGDVYVMWKMNNGQYMEGSSTVHINEKNTAVVLSYLTVSGKDYNSAQFACAVKDPNMVSGATPEQKTTSMNDFSLKINPPSAKDLFEQNKATITCVVTGDNKNEVGGSIVSWTVGGRRRGSSGTDNVKQTTPPFTKTSSLTLDQSEWFSGSEVKCSTEREKTPFSDKIKVKKGGKPSIVFYKPEKEVRDTETVSLLCEVRSSGLGDVYVMWKMNNGQYMEGSSTVHINEKNTAVVLSYLTVSGKEYNSAQFACVVKDPNMVAGATPEQKTTSMTDFSLKINPPSAKDLFVRNKATITCVVTGDSKNEVDGAVVSWTVGGRRRESSGTDNVKQTTSPFTKTSSLTLDQSEWFSGSEVECSTEREKTPFSDKIKVKKGGKPSIVFYKPEKEVRDTETVSLLCEVRSSDLGDVYVMWKMNNGQYMEGSSTVHINEKNTAVVLSYLTVSGKEYNSAQFACAVKDPNTVAGATPEQKTTSMDDFSLKINPPSAKDLFVRNKATITCVVTGDNKNEVDGAIVSWTVGGSRRRNSGTDHVKQTTPPFTKTSSLTLDQSEWFSGTEVMCSTEREKTPFSDKIKVKKGGKPSIVFYKPEKDVKDTETVSLLCEVRSSDLGDVYVMWKMNNGQYMEGSSTVHINEKNTAVVLSYLTVSGKDYNSAQFACAVKDPNMVAGATPEQKTTSMTVFSLKINPPSAKDLFVHNKATITCVVTGDSKNEVDGAVVSWTVGGRRRESSGTDNVKQTTSPFTKTSSLTLDQSEWFSGSEVECSTEREKTPFSDKIKVKKGGKPSIVFYKPEKEVRDTETVSLLCEVRSSDLGDVYVMWKMNNGQYMEGSSTVHTNEKNTAVVLSYLTVSGKEYNSAQFACAVKDPNTVAGATPEQKTTSMDDFSLKINPPSAKDLFVRNKATITCVVTGDNKNEVDGAIVSWTVGGSRRRSSGTDHVKQTTPPFTKTSSLTLDQSEWFSGTEVKCSTEREKTPFSDKIKVKKGGKPSIVFYKPEKDVKDTETVSLLCEVRSSDLGDVYVMWKMNNGQYMEGSSTVHINEKNTAVVLSYLTVSGKDYNSAQFACVVKDPNMVAGATPEQKTTSMTVFSLKINPPSAKDLFVHNKATITCLVTGDNKNEVDGAVVSWTVGGSRRESSGTDNVKQTTPPFTKTSSLTLDQSEWFSGSEVECSTEREKTPFSDKIKVKKGGKRPSILLYKPDKHVKDTERVSLLCEVSSSDLGDVYVMWKRNNDQYMEGNSTVHINEKNTAVVLSFLTVSGMEYNSAQFACAVKDPNMVAGATPEQKTTSMRELPAPDPGLYINCDKDIPEEDDFNSLWSTASSFIFLFLFTVIYSTALSLFKMK
ncbi:uncharacterized protein [Salminus brasiliensis]|uniref:uncharacterized protein isoform X2 n=1 Tax=Salminus brasiliensis TaxID=930266 RepID=UPI003B82E5CA